MRRIVRRIFPALLERCGGSHERHTAAHKRELLAPLRGRVVEVGPGTGVNLAYLDRNADWIGVEPNEHMEPYLRRRAAALGRAVEVRRGTAEALPFDRASVDAVVSTLVLCSVADPNAALAEIRRVLCPGGQFVFIEHVAAPVGSRTRAFQHFIRPVWAYISDGCHPDRDTPEAIASAGFASVEIARFDLRMPIVGPHIVGRAVN